MFLPMKPLRVSVGDRLLHDLDQVAILAAQIDVAGLGADGESGNHDAFDDGVRIVLEDEAVFAGAGLALVAVAEHVLRLGRLLGHERPLHAGREARATAAAQVRRLDLVDDGVGAHADGLLQGLVAVELKIAVEVGRAQAKALGDDLYLIGMGNEISHVGGRAGLQACVSGHSHSLGLSPDQTCRRLKPAQELNVR